MHGKPSGFLALRSDNKSVLYIIAAQIFELSYDVEKSSEMIASSR
ncbi:hypothetical protein Thiowin_03807 [Thiorhodovibrio winogradskyi]|uniref:Uncharacterized protein n=1 Tax=Thiorhodovibrio winogradskyi TaxID=77007 RepID=A0ABZ0SEH9_9GAMM